MQERGNALFLILIAVALFAALSYAVTNSGRGGGGIDRELETIETAVNQQCNAMIDQGKMRLRVLGGCSENEISYELADGTNSNSDAPSDESCHLFRPSGAGIAACGSYLDPLIETGPIPYGDNTAVTLVASGNYARCTFSGECYPLVSPNGSDFRQPCLDDDATPTRYDFDVQFTYDFVEAFCQAACGGSRGYEISDSSGGATYTVNDDFSVREVSGTCTRFLRAFTCACW